MPFTRTTASADTCVLSDFITGGRPDLLTQLFPDGIWVDAAVIVELTDQFGASCRDRAQAAGLNLLVERGYDAAHYAEMAEIKRTRPGMRHADIVTVVLARKIGGLACRRTRPCARPAPCVRMKVLCPWRDLCDDGASPNRGRLATGGAPVRSPQGDWTADPRRARREALGT